MAKHIIDGKGKVSKGQRISCNKLIKKSNTAVSAYSYPTVMRNAFEQCKIKLSSVGKPHVASVIGAIQSHIGIIKTGRGWTANISRHTFHELKKSGVFA